MSDLQVARAHRPRVRRALAAVGAAALGAASLAVLAMPASAAPVVASELHWGVKASLRSYIVNIAGGSITPSGGATFEGSGPTAPYAWTGAGGTFDPATNAGTIDFAGTVVFSAPNHTIWHITLTNPTVVLDGDSTGTLRADVSYSTGGPDADHPTASATATDVPFADLTVGARTGTGPYTFANVAATLTAQGSSAFAGFYQPGEALDPLTFSVTPGAPPAPTVGVTDVSLVEGASGTKNAVFTVSLSQGMPGTVSVKYKTADGTAAAPGDYTAKALTALSFTAGQTSKTVAIPVKGDLYGESDETFSVALSSPVGIAIGDGTATGTILDDDAPAPSLTVAPVTVVEGDSGAKSAVFTFSLSSPSPAALSVKYATANGTAVAPTDYTAKAATVLSFAANQTSKTVAIALKPDVVDEPDEVFSLVLSAPVGLTLGQSTAQATIVDDDPPPPHVSIGDVAVTEGNTGTKTATFTVSLTHAAKTTVSVKYATANGTAAAPTDYTAKAATVLSFAPGQTSKTVPIALKPDVLGEPDETFTVNLSTPLGVVIDDAVATATILNDDAPAPQVTVGDVSIVEGSSGTKNLVFTVQLSAPAQGTVSMKYKTLDGTAVAPGDYTAKALTVLSVAAGQTSKTISIPIKVDKVDELDEVFQLVLSDPTAGLDIVDGTAAGTILDDD